MYLQKKEHYYVSIIEPLESVKKLNFHTSCRWAQTEKHNVHFEANQVTVKYATYREDQNRFTSERFFYRRIYHLISSTLQAQMIFYTGQVVRQTPLLPQMLETDDVLPLVKPLFEYKRQDFTNDVLSSAYDIGEMADIFPYLRWCLRDFYLTYFYPVYDSVFFCWRALSSILWHFADEKTTDAESSNHIQFVSSKICIDGEEFLRVKRLVNDSRFLGRHSTNRPSKRTHYIKKYFKSVTLFGSIIDESFMSSMAPMTPQLEAQLMKGAVDLTPPTLPHEEWIKLHQFVGRAIVKFIQSLGKEAVLYQIFPPFGTNPCVSSRSQK
jgi:hypothetical protein